MAANQSASVQRVRVNRSTIKQTLQTMQEFGKHGWEVLILWLGDIESGEARIVQAFTPKQKPISNENGVGYFVDGNTLFELNRDLAKTGLRLIAQVHSHPREAYHSEADDRYAIVTAEGGLSLVVPNFGKAPADPASWAIYRLRGRDWQEITTQEIRVLFSVTDD